MDVRDLYLYPPRGMDRIAAARYIGVGVTKFDGMVADRRMPSHKKVDDRTIWDRLQFDAASTDLPWRGDAGNKIDAILAQSSDWK